MLERWKTADEATRKRAFAPIKVRLEIEQRGLPLPINKDRYSFLSIYSVHASPDTLPQAHGPTAQAVTFTRLEPAGFLLVLNELALPVAFIAVFASGLAQLLDSVREGLRNMGRGLVENIGGVDITVDGRPWFAPN